MSKLVNRLQQVRSGWLPAQETHSYRNALAESYATTLMLLAATCTQLTWIPLRIAEAKASTKLLDCLQEKVCSVYNLHVRHTTLHVSIVC